MSSSETVKFLLVDDLEENLTALEALLRRDGLEQMRAGSAREALELLLVHDFALALLDVRMPDMDGFELAELMRGTERTRHIPIIFLTAVATDEHRRFRGYETGAVDYLYKPVDSQLLRNKATVYFDLHRQKQELARQRDELGHSKEQLQAALSEIREHTDNSPIGMLQFGPDLRLSGWSKGAERILGWPAGEMLGKPVGALPWAGQEDAMAVEALFSVLANGREPRARHVARSRHKQGGVIECEWYSSVLFDASGTLISIKSQLLDVTERRRAEATQQLLVAELNHRVKNMLATVQAIASQTLRYSTDPASFSAKFSGRIDSLARAHSLLSNTVWQGAQLEDLIGSQLRIGTLDETRLTAAGPPVRLSPQQALHVGLILHELGTNAIKHGAFSIPQGHVTLHWTVEAGMLHLEWAESGTPLQAAPNRTGFGSILIERSAQAEGGRAEVRYAPDGLRWRIDLCLQPAAEVADTPPMAFDAAPPPAPLPLIADIEGVAAPERQACPLSTGIAGRRFLVIEDEPLIAMELAHMLKDAGAQVLGPADTVERALQMVETGAFDAALLDGNLRGKPVDPIARALARLGLPFIFVTGYSRKDLPEIFQESCVLAKPFSEEELLRAAAAIVQGPAAVPPGRLRPPVPATAHGQGSR